MARRIHPFKLGDHVEQGPFRHDVWLLVALGVAFLAIGVVLYLGVK